MFSPFNQFFKKDPAILKFPSPNKYFTQKKWVNMVVHHIAKNTLRDKIFLFDNFPPEYVDYYKALQEKIAELIPAEQDRPFICLNIKGSSESTTPKIGQYYANVGMAGGTGPLSDATALTNLIAHMSGIDFPLKEEDREKIAKRMQDFSGIMYSMPPPRDVRHLTRDAITYAKLYRKARKLWPCLSLHILTNTGHSNKAAFDGLLGPSWHGLVEDMTVKVADRILQESNANKILILGTIQADHDRLYFNLLSQRNLNSIYPEEVYQNKNSKEYLQTIIDQAKAGKVTKNMPGELRTCGQAFIDFALHYALQHGCRTLLFSCTELPMLLHTQIPGENRTYLDKLEETFKNSFPAESCTFYDTEKIFVEEIANASRKFQTDPQARSERLRFLIQSMQENRQGKTQAIHTGAKTHDFIIAGEEQSFIQDVVQTFKLYDEIIYTLLKWSITVPITLIGNLLDLLCFNLPKKCIDTSSTMQVTPFFRVLTRIKEDGYVGRLNDMMNKGFGGLARCITSIALELPISLVVVLIASVLTAVHQLVAKTIVQPIAAMGRLVQDTNCADPVQIAAPL